MASESSGPPVRRLDVHQRPCKNHAKAAFSIEPLVKRAHAICKECCTLSEVERSMLVSAQTDRFVLRKNAPRTDNLKRGNDLLKAVVKE